MYSDPFPYFPSHSSGSCVSLQHPQYLSAGSSKGLHRVTWRTTSFYLFLLVLFFVGSSSATFEAPLLIPSDILCSFLLLSKPFLLILQLCILINILSTWQKPEDTGSWPRSSTQDFERPQTDPSKILQRECMGFWICVSSKFDCYTQLHSQVWEFIFWNYIKLQSCFMVQLDSWEHPSTERASRERWPLKLRPSPKCTKDKCRTRTTNGNSICSLDSSLLWVKSQAHTFQNLGQKQLHSFKAQLGTPLSVRYPDHLRPSVHHVICCLFHLLCCALPYWNVAIFVDPKEHPDHILAIPKSA